MDRMISMCGLVCSECGAYLALRDDDDEMRRKTAAEWAQQFGVDIKPETINCSGCTSAEGVVFHHCTECEIRACGKGRKVPNCAYCDDYPCAKLEGFFQMAPQAKATLGEVRKNR